MGKFVNSNNKNKNFVCLSHKLTHNLKKMHQLVKKELSDSFAKSIFYNLASLYFIYWL